MYLQGFQHLEHLSCFVSNLLRCLMANSTEFDCVDFFLLLRGLVHRVGHTLACHHWHALVIPRHRPLHLLAGHRHHALLAIIGHALTMLPWSWPWSLHHVLTWAVPHHGHVTHHTCKHNDITIIINS